MSRVLVCGTREGFTRETVWNCLDRVVKITGAEPAAIIVGDCRGPDLFAKEWAQLRSIPCDEFVADWKQHGLAAGPRRNAIMLRESKPDAVLAFWDGKSPGTIDMITRAVRAGVSVRIVAKQS